ncbi:uncharacterized protein HMPREF1120_04945 [Exophiala dermatitidis NIH/UT8656]|uniref:Uncharacterized protein n=1 Tax=Exophiala dermatitidis (strain ATCC 34100 / CBS 525.76 / NIH/UT8656) TaxID=858893 RepID=H6BZ18_EXODN|nr:uncharacterized protein HMPREF1120_04945 [Exophiala dermatitidis NIH/UT8656]EHY56881.1 hypothetical protein HMPREF1120_04945 [Exophiala dermatitidis NIH/UT8656]
MAHMPDVIREQAKARGRIHKDMACGKGLTSVDGEQRQTRRAACLLHAGCRVQMSKRRSGDGYLIAMKRPKGAEARRGRGRVVVGLRATRKPVRVRLDEVYLVLWPNSRGR